MSAAVCAIAAALAHRPVVARRRARGAAATSGAVQRPAHHRLRPRARHAEPLQHAHPRGHPVGVVEGLTVTDEQMQDRAAARRRSTRRSRTAASCCGPMAAWTSPGSCGPDITWHDGMPFTSADVKFTVDAINEPDYNPESTDGFDRITSVDTPDSLTAVVHYREVYAPYALQFIRGMSAEAPARGARHRSRQRLQPHARSAPVRIASPSGRPASTSCSSACRTTGAARRRSRRLLFKFLPNTNTRINQLKAGEVHIVAHGAVGQASRAARRARARRSIARRATPTSTSRSTNGSSPPSPMSACGARSRMAVDRELIARTILDGLAPVTHGPIQPVSWAYTRRRHAVSVRSGAGARAARRSRLARRRRRRHPRARRRSRSRSRSSRRPDSRSARTWRRRCSGSFATSASNMSISLHDGTSISQLWFEGDFDAMLHWWQMPADPELTLFFAADRTPPAGRNINYVERRFADAAASTRRIARSIRRRAQALLRDGAASHRRAGGRRFRCTTSPSSTRCPATLQRLQGQSDQRGRVLERARVGAQNAERCDPALQAVRCLPSPPPGQAVPLLLIVSVVVLR